MHIDVKIGVELEKNQHIRALSFYHLCKERQAHFSGTMCKGVRLTLGDVRLRVRHPPPPVHLKIYV